MDLKRVCFVKATATDETICIKTDIDKTQQQAADGNEVKSFYEDLVGINQRSPQPSCSIESHTPENILKIAPLKEESTPSNNRYNLRTRAEVDVNARLRKGCNDFLRCAQDGDLQGIKLHLQRGLDINVQDSFGWTAVMCATSAGQYEVLQFLLKEGANVYMVDNKNKSALDVAKSIKSKKQKQISQLIQNFINWKPDWELSESNTTHVTFYCETCKGKFSDISKKKHETSTLHIFNGKPKAKGTFYHLTENNKGFKLLVQSGWDKEKGLGPEGKGNKFPVKTVLKRDRLGLGNRKISVAKVTHFAARDTDAVQTSKPPGSASLKREMKQTTISKRKRAKLLSKEQQKEMNFRLDFNT